MHHCNYCKRCTTCTSCCWGSWWLLPYLWYLKQQDYWSPIVEVCLWDFWMHSHQKKLPLTCSLSENGTSCHTCDRLYLTSKITLLHFHYYFHCCGSWIQLDSEPCYLNSNFPKFMPSGVNIGIDPSTLRWQVPITVNQQGSGINMLPLVQGTHRWWAPLVLWHTCHTHEVSW